MSVWAWLERIGGDPRDAGADASAAVRYHAVRVGIALVLALITYAFFPASPAAEIPLYEVGSVASDNVIAPFAFKVRKPDDQLEQERTELEQSVEPIFAYAADSLALSRQQLEAFMRAVGSAVSAATAREDTQAVVAAAASAGLRLTPREAGYLVASERRNAMSASVTLTFNRLLATGVASASSLEGVTGPIIVRRGGEERRIPRDSIVAVSDYLTQARAIHPPDESTAADAVYTKLLAGMFHPTIVLDVVATERARGDMRRSVDEFAYEVQAAEKIIGANEVVSPEEHEKLRALQTAAQERRASGEALGRVAGAVLFDFLLIAMFGITLLLFRPQLYSSARSVSLFGLVFAVVIGIAAMIGRGPLDHPELVPIALAAIIFSVLFDPRISVIAAMILAVLIGGQGPFRGTNALFINLIGGVAAAFSVRVLRRRNQAWYSFIMIASAYLLAAVALGLTLGWPFREFMLSALWGGVNAFASVLLAMQLLPLAEEFTGIDTDLKLLEWSDLNRTLMRKLSLEAPGTYAHTMAIANLAESAANAIEANGLLARVGAYYHDIGKLKKPQYFVENQPKGRNPHDKLKPSTSASIIRNHVKEGMELADEHRLPRAIRAFITEHHGTGQIAYFLEKAKERDGPVSNPGEYAYPGPVPQTAETAIVMLADGIEAATRVIHEPTPQKIREVVDHIVRQRMEQGQLRDAPLTLKQLDTVKDQFARVLIGMYHNRIDYPASGGGVTAEFAPV
ncbi:MAG: HD family phosphohydrolase [Gemmatimonadaceae bacterium]